VSLNKLGESDFEDLEVKVEKICCKFCTKKFVIPANLDLHVRGIHRFASENVKLKCFFCSKLIAKTGFKKHLKLLHKGKGVRCRFKKCSSVFSSEKNMQEHLKLKHLLEDGKKLIECKLCKYLFSCKISLGHHLKYHSKKIFNCTFCTKSFENRVNWYFHTKENHKSEAVKCQLNGCKLVFLTKELMEQHFENTHKNQCKFCHFNFTYRRFLLSHLNKVHAEKRCKFSRCIFYTGSKEELEKHEIEKHGRTDKLPNECIFCRKSFGGNRNNLYQHVRRTHPNNIAFWCDYPKCSLFVKSSEALEKHIKDTHLDLKKSKNSVVCFYCQKTLSERNILYSHLKNCHSGEVLKCKYRQCSTYFKSEEDLQKHYEEKHAGGKFNCALCGHNTKRRDQIIESIFSSITFRMTKSVRTVRKSSGSSII